MEGALAVAYTPNGGQTAAVSPDGKYIVGCESTLWFTKIRFWNSTTGQLAETLKYNTRKIYSISFSPDSRYILSASGDKRIYIHILDY
jgi:WD40 repeat protein